LRTPRLESVPMTAEVSIELLFKRRVQGDKKLCALLRLLQPACRSSFRGASGKRTRYGLWVLSMELTAS